MADRLKSLERQLARIEDKIAEELLKPRFETLGLEDDAVLWFQIAMPDRPRCDGHSYYDPDPCADCDYDRDRNVTLYSYAALRVPALDKWVVTGPKQASRYYTWGEIYDEFLSKADQSNGVLYASKWEKVL